jgi:hypothetical protein
VRPPHSASTEGKRINAAIKQYNLNITIPLFITLAELRKKIIKKKKCAFSKKMLVKILEKIYTGDKKM